eukprot:m.12415 g.12415  ORF g.12415 m.12415 type:complete len:514 (+) comp2945_c0_seq1:483-2024(+)
MPFGMSKQTHATVAGLVGNILEWYDFAVYGALAENIGAAFFPSECNSPDSNSNTTLTTTLATTSTTLAPHVNECVDHNLIESFAVFGGAFLMRPIGALVFGAIGDKTGRKRALELSVLVMCIATVTMGCLPTHKQAGVAAPILLCIVRLIQGVSVGGELIGSIVYTTETAPNHRWGLYASFALMTAVLGTALGMAVGAVMHAALTKEQLNDWGWRIPFLAGILLGVVGIWLRQSIDDTEMFLAAKAKGQLSKHPLWDAVTVHRAALAVVFGVVSLWASGFYICFIWMRVYLTTITPHPIPNAHGIAAGVLVWLCAVFPAMGHASDVLHSRNRVMLVGGSGMALLSAVLFTQARDGAVGGLTVCLLVYAVALAAWGAPMCAWMVETFPIEARYSAVAIGYNAAHAVIGGTTLLLCTYLATEVDVMAPGYFMTAIAVVSTSLLALSPRWLATRYGPDTQYATFNNAAASGMPESGKDAIEMSTLPPLDGAETRDTTANDHGNDAINDMEPSTSDA